MDFYANFKGMHKIRLNNFEISNFFNRVYMCAVKLKIHKTPKLNINTCTTHTLSDRLETNMFTGGGWVVTHTRNIYVRSKLYTTGTIRR